MTLKKFKRTCIRDGIFSELRKRCYYEKPSLKRRKKAEATKRLAIKRGVL
ncbi:MAG: 30S ribosomal protein S21 [Planctomycetota bacterium]